MEEDKLSITKYTRRLSIKLTITKEKSAGYQNDNFWNRESKFSFGTYYQILLNFLLIY